MRVKAPKAAGLRFSMAWHFTDRADHWLLELSNGALSSIQQGHAPAADVSLRVDRPTLEALLQQRLAPMQAISDGKLQLSGNATLLGQFFGLLDRFSGSFAVVDAQPWPDAAAARV